MGFPRLDISYTVEKLPAKTAGQAHLYSKIVKINTLYLKEHKESILSDTLPHEICHIYQAHYFPNAKQSHGPEVETIDDCYWVSTTYQWLCYE